MKPSKAIPSSFSNSQGFCLEDIHPYTHEYP